MKLWNHKYISCFIKKISMILLQFLTILCPYQLCVTQQKKYVNKGCNLLNPYLLTVFLSIHFNKLPCSETWFLERGLRLEYSVNESERTRNRWLYDFQAINIETNPKYITVKVSFSQSYLFDSMYFWEVWIWTRSSLNIFYG